jgi:hypothetical protein
VQWYPRRVEARQQPPRRQGLAADLRHVLHEGPLLAIVIF